MCLHYAGIQTPNLQIMSSLLLKATACGSGLLKKVLMDRGKKKVLSFCTVVTLNKYELQCSASPAVTTPNEAGQTQGKLCS